MFQDVLAGIRVIDVTSFAFMPVVGGVLAQWGADVIKVESPKACDPMRLLFGGTTEPGGAFMSFKNYNRGKRAISIDLSDEAGQQILYRLVGGADVFLTSNLPNVRRKLKIDVDDIRQHNPEIIYAKGTGFGPRGPEAERRGYDSAAWWARGSLAATAMEVSGSPVPTGMVGHGDTISGTVLAGGICAALLRRERTGITSVVDGSLLGTAIWYNHQPIVASRFGVKWGGPPTPRETHAPTLTVYRTKDERYVSLVFVNDPDGDWNDLCAHLERPDLASDPRFSSSSDRSANRAAAVEQLDLIFAEKTLDEWKSILSTTRGVWAPIQTPTEIHDDPQTQANGFIRRVDYPTGPINLPVPPVLYDGEAGDIGPAPDYCQHTDEVLQEAGYSIDEIADYRNVGVVA